MLGFQLLVFGLSPSAAVSERPDSAEAALQEDPRELLRDAQAATAAADYERALEAFERAYALKPAPKLHYNIAVCHHRLLLRAENTRDEMHRVAAVEGYNRYLSELPDAPDRAEVAALVRSLGGRPASLDDWLVDPLVDGSNEKQGEEVSEFDATDTAREGLSTTSAAPGEHREPVVTPSPDPYRGRLGLALGTSLANMQRLRRSDRVQSSPHVAAAMRAAVFLGERRRLHLGFEIGTSGQPTTNTARHFITAFWLGSSLEYAQPLGQRRRFEIGAGPMIAATVQRLRHRGDSDVRCPARRGVSTRGGALLAGRVSFSALLGPSRGHELALRVTPGVGLHGDGTSEFGMLATLCEPPFTELQLVGPEFVVAFDVGYAARF